MLYFMRHGQVKGNVDKVFVGQRVPASLTPLGIQQAEEAARRMNGEHIRIDQIVTSPLERALRTAEIVAPLLGIDPSDIRTDPRLMEYDMGDLSGTSKEGVTSAQLISAPNAEDPRAFQHRVEAALGAAAVLPGNTLLVSHNGVGRMIEATKQGFDPARFYELQGYPNARVVELALPQSMQHPELER